MPRASDKKFDHIAPTGAEILKLNFPLNQILTNRLTDKGECIFSPMFPLSYLEQIVKVSNKSVSRKVRYEDFKLDDFKPFCFHS